MIVVEVKLVSAISRDRDRLLGSMVICNQETSPDGKYADYDVRVGRKTDAGDVRKVYAKPLRRGQVVGHARLAQNVWRLVLKALAAAFPEQRVQLPEEGEAVPTHRHKKGGLYTVLHRGVHTETEEPVVVYAGEDGKVWVRPAAMFDEPGRFEAVDGR